MKSLDGSLDPTLSPTPTSALTNRGVVGIGDTMDAADEPVGRARSATFAPSGYRLGEVLGRGGMGEVVLAHDGKMGRDVAIKRLRATAPSADAIERFTREAKIQARLDHPAIVPVHELAEDGEGRPYFTMKRLAGTTMHQVLAAPSVLPDSTMMVGDPRQRLLRAFVDVCLAMDFAHARGVVHRDLKPANIMLGDYGEVYVLDWGVARVIGDLDRPPSIADIPMFQVVEGASQTQTGALLGTPGYMAPEQLRGDLAVGPASDVYALGSILFEILAGESLHPRGSEAIATTLANPTASPAERAPDESVAPELAAICVAALAKTAAERPSARAIAHRVQRYLDGDRDMEHRCALADAELRLAKSAFASGDPSRRAEAMRAAGRALALDPESREAAAMVAALVLEPPSVLPRALTEQIDRTDGELVARQNRYASYALFAYFLFVPLLAWVGITDWAVIGGACLVIAIMGVTAIWMARKKVVYIELAIVGNIVLLTLFSRIFGPWVAIPGLAGGIAVMLQTAPKMAERPWRVIIGMIIAGALPLVLEAVGILESTWEIADGALITRPTAVNLDGTPAIILLVATNLGLVVVMSLVSRASALAWRATSRSVEIQTWHLKQLLPITEAKAIEAENPGIP